MSTFTGSGPGLAGGEVLDGGDQPLAVAPCERSRISVLWSLLGDDANLTWVEMTYGGQRLDWPLRSLSPELTPALWLRIV